MKRYPWVLLNAGALCATVVATPQYAFASGATPIASLRADGNRTGHIDMVGPDSAAGRTALFLANIDDDTLRCRDHAKTIIAEAAPREEQEQDDAYAKEEELRNQPDTPETEAAYEKVEADLRVQVNQADRELAACNDAGDSVVNGPRDLADLARLRTMPWAEAPSSATGRLTVAPDGASHVHLFIHRPGSSAPLGWDLVTTDTVLSAAELRSGVELGIEGKDIIRDSAEWDGSVTVTLSSTANGRTATSSATMQEAPILTQLNTQRVTRALTATPDPSDDIGVAWRKAVLNAAKAEGATHGGQELPTSDTWVQDDFEPAYTSIPGPGGTPHGMHVLINSVNDARRVASRDVFTDLVGHDVAAVHTEHAFDPEEDSSLDSMGNLETIPAAPGHPNGRIVLGQDTGLPDSDGPAPEILTMLRSQGQQDPIMLDTSWLDVGHVDEFLQFVPVPSSRRGWKVLVADPDAGVDLLRQVRHAGQGSERLHTGLPPTLPWPYDGIVDQRTVDEYLADAQFVDTNRVAAARIDANVQRLMQAAGITNVDIVRLPVVYTARTFDWLMLKQSIDGMADGPDKDAQIAKLNGLRVATADTANVVNGLDLNGGRYFAPKPFGPLLDGVDVFEQATTAALQRAGLHVTYLDDFLSEHESAGELHCASNTLRDALGTTNTWWAG